MSRRLLAVLSGFVAVIATTVFTAPAHASPARAVAAPPGLASGPEVSVTTRTSARAPS